MSSPKASRPGKHLEEVLDQKSLAGTDVEHAVAGLEAEVLDDVLGHRDPAAVVAVAAVAVLARPVEIELAVLPRDIDDLLRLCLGAGVDVALAARKLR